MTETLPVNWSETSGWAYLSQSLSCAPLTPSLYVATQTLALRLLSFPHTSTCHSPANPCQPPVEPQTDAIPVLTAACCAARPDLLVDPCLELNLFQDSEKRPLLVGRPGPCVSSRVVFTLKPSRLPSHLRLVMALNTGLPFEPEPGNLFEKRFNTFNC